MQHPHLQVELLKKKKNRTQPYKICENCVLNNKIEVIIIKSLK